MKLIHCAMCHVSFLSRTTDVEAAARFEAEHGVDIASVPVAVVCGGCAEIAREWMEGHLGLGDVEVPAAASVSMH